MKTTDLLIIGGALVGGVYLLSKYFKPTDLIANATKNIIDKTVDTTKTYIVKGTTDNFKTTQVFKFNKKINSGIPQAKQTQDFLNISSFITRNNPFTRTISPIIDYTLKFTSETINKYLGG